jgi:hypothetical protein
VESAASADCHPGACHAAGGAIFSSEGMTWNMTLKNGAKMAGSKMMRREVEIEGGRHRQAPIKLVRGVLKLFRELHGLQTPCKQISFTKQTWDPFSFEDWRVNGISG